MERRPGTAKRLCAHEGQHALSSPVKHISDQLQDLLTQPTSMGCLTHASHGFKLLGIEQQITSKFLLHGTLSIYRH